MANYKYDAFLSYSNLDVEWAEALEKDLLARDVKVWRDKTRLTAGNDWNRDLQEAIRNSRHLIVLWTGHAQQSQWVTNEMTHFDMDKGDTPGRRHIQVKLQGQCVIYPRYHAIEVLETAGVYCAGFAALKTADPPWQKALAELERALDKEERIPVHKVVLVSTLNRLQAIRLDKQIAFMPPYEEALEGMGIKQDGTDTWKTELAKYYGADRADWKPFGGANKIDAILDRLALDIQGIASAPKFRWESIDDRFGTVNANGRDDATTLEVVNAEIRKLLGDLVHIVIDPISLYDDVVFNRLAPLRTNLQNNPTATSVLAPFPIPKPTALLRKLIETGAGDLFKQSFEPVFGEDSRLSVLEVCALEDRDLKRLLGASLRYRKAKPEIPAVLANRT
jgi:hypothetical protein